MSTLSGERKINSLQWFFYKRTIPIYIFPSVENILQKDDDRQCRKQTFGRVCYYYVHCICRTRELTWKVFVADGQSSLVSWSQENGRGEEKKNLRASEPFKRAQLNCENSEEKSSSATCLHIERTFKYHSGGYYTHICICVQHILYFILYYTHYRSRSTTIHSRRVPRTPQHASNDFARGSFELFPKAIGTDVFICKARNSYWKLFTKNIRTPACIRYTAVVYILVFSMCGTGNVAEFPLPQMFLYIIIFWRCPLSIPLV